MTDSIILVGGGGHCKACIEVIENSGVIIKGIIDKQNGEGILNYGVIGTDSDIKMFVDDHLFLIAVGQIQSASLRKKLFDLILSNSGKFASIVSNHSLVSRYSHIGKGTIIMNDVIVNADSSIGANCIINNKALIEHDCIVGDHTHVSTAAVINGNCKVGNEVFIGSNAVLSNGITIGDKIVVGAGSVIIKDLVHPGVYAGNPAKLVKS